MRFRCFHFLRKCSHAVKQTIILEDSGKDLKRSGKAIPQSPDRRSIIVANTASEKKGKRMSMAFKKRTGSLKKDKVLKLKDDKKKKKWNAMGLLCLWSKMRVNGV